MRKREELFVNERKRDNYIWEVEFDMNRSE
jgi:hypothetical protein